MRVMKARAKWWVFAVAMTMFVACSDDRNGRSGGSSSVDSDADLDASVDASDTSEQAPLPDASRDLNGPEILEFSVSPERLTEGGQMTITVAITDPQGFDDIGGGRILDESGESYGIFGGAGGTYSATETWDQINNVSPISFESAQQTVFVAEFFDSADNRTTRPFYMELHCNGFPACDGTCEETRCTEACANGGVPCEAGSCMSLENLSSDQNCGACGNVCGGGMICDGLQCACAGGPDEAQCGDECVDLMENSDHCGECGNACSDSRACSNGSCEQTVASGSPCAEDEDCPAGYCSTFGPQNICMVQCSDEAPCAGNHVCESIGPYQLCLKPCTGDADCSEGTECQNLRTISGDDRAPDIDACYIPV
jgi:hypothetical protein